MPHTNNYQVIMTHHQLMWDPSPVQEHYKAFNRFIMSFSAFETFATAVNSDKIKEYLKTRRVDETIKPETLDELSGSIDGNMSKSLFQEVFIGYLKFLDAFYGIYGVDIELVDRKAQKPHNIPAVTHSDERSYYVLDFNKIYEPTPEAKDISESLSFTVHTDTDENGPHQ